MGQNNEEDTPDEEEPMILLGQLKMLYDLHKEDLNENDQIKILASLYLKENIAYRYYREKLFEKIAKKTIE